MRYINHRPGVTPQRVARFTGLQRSNLSSALRSLERRGLVRRRADPADARSANLFRRGAPPTISPACAINGPGGSPRRSAVTLGESAPAPNCSRASNQD